MLRNSECKVLLTHRGYGDQIDFIGEVLDLDDSLSEYACDNLENFNTSDDLAYVMYTSGSTGNPKGVMIEHGGVHNFFCGTCNEISFLSGRTILALTTISFDISVAELLLPLSRGLKIIIADQSHQMDVNKLIDLIAEHNIEMLQTTPTRMQFLIDQGTDLSRLNCLKDIMLGGEATPETLLSSLKRHVKAKIYNMYGPTETTVYSSIKDLTDTTEIVIGKPLANTQFYVKDQNDNILPIGIAGELLISGDGVARGYIHQPELTAERFADNQLLAGKRVYRTGDLVRYKPDGCIEYLGRMDSQIKIRGVRIELEEIVNILLQHDLIRNAAVTVIGNTSIEKKLVAYVVVEPGFTTSKVTDYMSKKLPTSMIPSLFIEMEQLPTTLNGKIDRLSLKVPDSMLNKETECVGTASEIEEELFMLWKKYLKTESLGTNYNFFEMGGTSIIAMQVIAGLNSFTLELKDFFRYQTIAELSRHVKPIAAGSISETKESNIKPAGDYRRVVMESAIVLDNMNPFNEVFYRSCFYNALFPIIQYYSQGFEAILANDVLLYTADQDNMGMRLNIRYQCGKEIAELLMEMGLKAKTIIYCDDIVGNIMNAISNGRPVVIRIDCFFQRIRMDTYNKNHWPHALLIHGFDQSEQVFYVIEHENIDTLTYKKQTISYEDIQKAYQGYQENFQKGENTITYYEVFMENDVSDIGKPDRAWELHIKSYASNYISYQDQIMKGLSELRLFGDALKRIVSDIASFKMVVDALIFNLNDIVNAKVAEKYKMQVLMNQNDQVISVLDEIIQGWVFIRSIAIKYEYSSKYKNDSFEKMIQAIDNICSKEYQYNELLKKLFVNYL